MRHLFALLAIAVLSATAHAVDPPPIVTNVEGQPLAANAVRLTKALEFLGFPLSDAVAKSLTTATEAKDAKAVQTVLDPLTLFVVTLNPEARVKVARGPANVVFQQAGYVPVIVKVLNDSTVKKPLKISSPQGGKVYGPNWQPIKNPKADLGDKNRFLDLEMFTASPMTGELSGLSVEYAIAIVYSTEAGKREATFAFDVGQGTQDLGFRGEVPVLFDVKPAVPVTVRVVDENGKPTVGRFTFRDAAGHIYPPQAKRLAPDFFFQQQVYRADGGTVLLAPGEFTVEYSRGPEYHQATKKLVVPAPGNGRDVSPVLSVKLERWTDPTKYGWFNGDHHIHAAGCKHYASPTEGVMPEDMFLHVKGEGMNVGCCLTWGPCYEFQRQFFDPKPWERSEPFTILKYDVEISGFGSQALGHVCLLNLRDQTYPGSEGTKTKGWPTWTTPVMRWTKAQGGVTGYAHSATGLGIVPKNAAERILKQFDKNGDGKLSYEEAKPALLPRPIDIIDQSKDGELDLIELGKAQDWASTQLPNLALPEMNGIGAQEIFVSSAMGVCDFISSMDTARVPEWNCWYHIMNCGFPLKVSGETDFPCITGSRVGQGRVYVQMGKIDRIDYADWCKGIAQGRSYVSDGYAHALKFTVNEVSPGFGEVKLDKPGTVNVTAKVSFGANPALGTANGGLLPTEKTRLVELVMNGEVVASKVVPADNAEHDITFAVPVAKSSWLALRQFPQLHTNPVPVLIGGKPIRASKVSARWCVEAIEQLWRVRRENILEAERAEAEKTFQQAIAMYKAIAAEATE